jgi:hypothetical protein
MFLVSTFCVIVKNSPINYRVKYVVLGVAYISLDSLQVQPMIYKFESIGTISQVRAYVCFH